MKMDFLDLTVHATLVSNSVSFSFSLFRKPSFRPNYLAALSCHPLDHKRSIFKCEALRILLCCSREHEYKTCMISVCNYLSDRGYPSREPPVYDAGLRTSLIGKHRCRQTSDNIGASCHAHGSSEPKRRTFLVLPFCSQAKYLNIRRSYLQRVRSVIPIDIHIAWAVNANSSRILYRLNWPY